LSAGSIGACADIHAGQIDETIAETTVKASSAAITRPSGTNATGKGK
jgi:hypothetical protein